MNWILRTATTLSLTGSGRAPFLLLLQADWSMAVVLAARWVISSEPTKRPNKDFVTRSSIHVARGTSARHRCTLSGLLLILAAPSLRCLARVFRRPAWHTSTSQAAAAPFASLSS